MPLSWRACWFRSCFYSMRLASSINRFPQEKWGSAGRPKRCSAVHVFGAKRGTGRRPGAGLRSAAASRGLGPFGISDSCNSGFAFFLVVGRYTGVYGAAHQFFEERRNLRRSLIHRRNWGATRVGALGCRAREEGSADPRRRAIAELYERIKRTSHSPGDSAGDDVHHRHR